MLYSAAKALAQASAPDEEVDPPADKTPDEKVAEAKTAIQDLSPITIAKEKGVALDADGIKAKVKENIISAAFAKGVTVTEAQIAIEITNTLGTQIRDAISHYLPIEPFGIEGPVKFYKNQ